MRGEVGQQVDHLVAEGDSRRCGRGAAALSATLYSIGRWPFSSSARATDSRAMSMPTALSERMAVVEQAQEAALVAAIVEHRRGAAGRAARRHRPCAARSAHGRRPSLLRQRGCGSRWRSSRGGPSLAPVWERKLTTVERRFGRQGLISSGPAIMAPNRIMPTAIAVNTPSRPQAQPLDGEPAAGRRHDHAGDAGEERRLHAARALAGEAQRHAEPEQAVERRDVRDVGDGGGDHLRVAGEEPRPALGQQRHDPAEDADQAEGDAGRRSRRPARRASSRCAPTATPTSVVRPEPMPKASGTSMNSSRTPMP